MERLTVKNLGPIEDFTLETNRLTVIIGPQASGKSLLAQMLFFFKEFEAWLAGVYPAVGDESQWIEDNVLIFLSRLRGVPIQHFLEHASAVQLSSIRDSFNIFFDCQSLGEYQDNWVTRAKCSQSFLDYHVDKIMLWDESKSKLSLATQSSQIYIPTERSMYTRLRSMKQSLLYSESMPYTMVKFSEQLDYCAKLYSHEAMSTSLSIDRDMFSFFRDKQEEALSGRVCLAATAGERPRWKWSLPGRGDRDFFPLSGASSGQMETWPFFVLADVFGTSPTPHDFYFEEPETHLHPRAQVEVIKTIAFLLSLGHRFVITTHSPFILYIINTLIQAHIAYEGAPPRGEFSIDPDHVAAYRLGDNPGSIMNAETKLLDLTEIDSVFDDINVSFGKYMDMEFAKHGK